MSRGIKTENVLTKEERLEHALVSVEEQPYPVPENWCWVRLSALSKIISKGTTPSGGKNIYTDVGVAFLRVENLNEDGTISHENIAHVPEDVHLHLLNRSILEEGDILISIAGTLGKTGIVRNVDLPLNTNQALAFVRLANKEINEKYIKYCIDNPAIQKLLLGKTKVTSIPNLTLEIIGNCYIPLSPVAEQKRIVDRIDSLFARLDEAKEKAQIAVDSFETRKAAILHKAFAGKLTNEWRKAHDVANNTWITMTLQDICEKITCGKTPKEFICPDGEIPFLKVYNIVNDTIAFEEAPQFIPRHIHESRLRSSILYPHDVVMNIVGPPLRKIAIIPGTYPEWNMNQAMVRFRPTKKLNYRFLYYALVNPETLDDVILATKGVVGQANISVTQSRNLKISVPSLEEQIEIVRILDSLFAKEQQAKKVAETALEQIEIMKKAILTRAFRGELETNDPTEENAVELLKDII